MASLEWLTTIGVVVDGRRRWTCALVTGASEGIGAAFARELAGRACDVVLVARRRERLEELAAELSARHGVHAEVLAADLTVAADIARVEQRLDADARAVDLLVNNAGGATEHAPFLRADRELLHRDAHLNALSVLRLTHCAAQAMAARGGGDIVNVSAGVAFYPLPGGAAYGAAKAFVNSLSEALAYELRGSGVGLTAVCPGFTRTDAQRRLGMQVERVPAALWMEPEDVAEAALRAAAGRRPVSSLNAVGEISAWLGRHLPRRVWLPAVAQGQARLAGHPTTST